MALALLNITFQKLANFGHLIPSLACSHVQMIQIVEVVILYMPRKPTKHQHHQLINRSMVIRTREELKRNLRMHDYIPSVLVHVTMDTM